MPNEDFAARAKKYREVASEYRAKAEASASQAQAQTDYTVMANAYERLANECDVIAKSGIIEKS